MEALGLQRLSCKCVIHSLTSHNRNHLHCFVTFQEGGHGQQPREPQQEADLSRDFRERIESDAGIVYKLQIQLKSDVIDDETCDADWNAQEVRWSGSARKF